MNPGGFYSSLFICGLFEFLNLHLKESKYSIVSSCQFLLLLEGRYFFKFIAQFTTEALKNLKVFHIRFVMTFCW